MPEIELTRPSDVNWKAELDICCSVDGSVVIGECKSNPADLKQPDIRKYEGDISTGSR